MKKSNHTKSKTARPVPVFKVFLKRARGAPKMPDKTALAAACLRAWALAQPKRCPEAFDWNVLSLDVHLLNDAEMAKQNAQFMQHEGTTDVLSFPIVSPDPERNTFNIGDVLIGFDVAKREAEERGITLGEEITRYCVHGFLHCMGYDDITPAKRRAMFAIQEKAVLGA